MTVDGGGREAEQLPELSVQPGLMQTVMYAAAMWEFQRLHFDEAWARREGLAAPIVQGPLLGNYLAQAVTGGLPARTELERLGWRNLAVVPVEERLRVGGTVAPPGADGRRTADLWIVDGSGSAVVTGTALLRPAGSPPARLGPT
jgi:hydroxyacyl-ACP dehydratase HTD2-like protein with hotdog domain